MGRKVCIRNAQFGLAKFDGLRTPGMDPLLGRFEIGIGRTAESVVNYRAGTESTCQLAVIVSVKCTRKFMKPGVR